MTVLTRRSMLSGAATAVAATTLTPFAPNAPASAAAPVAGKRAPGFYRYKVGDYEITIVNDGRLAPVAGPLGDP